jgi:hypothetical protein
MARVFAEESVQATIEDLCSRRKLQIGLLIGQNFQQKNFVVTAIATAAQENVYGDDDDQGLVDDVWVVEHARQVARMLPGGLDITGIFLVASESMGHYEGQLRKLIHKIYRVCNACYQLNSETVPDSTDGVERILLQISSTTRKYTCRLLDISDQRASLRPAEMKFQSFVSKWHKLCCTVSFDWMFRLPSIVNCLIASRQFQAHVKQELQALTTAVCVCDEQLRDESEPLEKPQKGRTVSMKEHYVKFLIDKATDTSKPSIWREESHTSILFQGSVQGLAYAHNKATIGEALSFIKSDVIRSVLARCDVLSEDLVTRSAEANDQSIEKTPNESGCHVLPRRVFFPVCHDELAFCDYMFQDEGANDVCNRLKELLGFDMLENQIESIEAFPGVFVIYY